MTYYNLVEWEFKRDKVIFGKIVFLTHPTPSVLMSQQTQMLLPPRKEKSFLVSTLLVGPKFFNRFLGLTRPLTL